MQHGASGLAGGGKVGARHAAPQGHYAGTQNFQRPFHGRAVLHCRMEGALDLSLIHIYTASNRYTGAELPSTPMYL